MMTTHIESSEEHESEDREDLKRRALAAIGRFRSDVTDLGVEHDRYLEEAFGSKSGAVRESLVLVPNGARMERSGRRGRAKDRRG